MKCPRCQHENPSQARYCMACNAGLSVRAKPATRRANAKRPVSRKAPKNADARVYDLEKRLAEALEQLQARGRELVEAYEQQTATSEILRAISSSPTDYQPVFNAIVRSAVRLVDGLFGALYRFDGTLIHFAAHESFTPEGLSAARRAFPLRPTSEVPLGRTILEGVVVHVPDAEAERGFLLQKSLGFRSYLSVPMLRDGICIGGIAVARAMKGPFSDRHIELLKTFADQAVIAIENVRLFNGTKEALDRQTATSEILRVISSSPTDVQPVFDAIVRSAVRLCGADHSIAARFDGELLHPLAFHGFSSEALELIKHSFPMRPTPALVVGRTALSRSVVSVPDTLTDPEYSREFAVAGGWRSGMGVPMLREGNLIGVIVVSRTEPGAFPDQYVELLKTFADQAVIAIENVRLFTELQEKNKALTQAHAQVTESLEQQTATSEILRVIAASPTNVQPVLEAVAESVARLCDSPDVTIFRIDGGILQLAVHRGPIGSLPPYGEERVSLDRGTVAGRSAIERRTIHLADLSGETDEYPESSARARRFGNRAILSVPLLRDDEAIGAIVVRRTEARSFTERQIALLRTFADQAVIAIENVRLFKELETRNSELTTSLERQTATSEILRVISGAQQDAQAVFDTIVQSAVRLCRAPIAAVFRVEDGVIYHPANYGGDSEALAAARARYPRPVDSQTMPGMIVLARSVVHIPDTEEVGLPDHVRQVGRILGFRSVVGVPMLREGEAVGALLVTRREPGRFSDAEVELLKTFSDQAVIAIENVRLFRELANRTEELSRSVNQLTALGEVGRAVSSTLDLETVLTTIVSRAVELSGVDGGVVFEYDETAEEFVQRAMTDTGEALAEARRATRIRKGEGVLGRTATTLEPVQVADIAAPGAYEGRLREILLASGIRAILAVPMVREGHLIGCLGVTRNRPGEFPAETIELLRTFATQSALAIQNARLFREIEQKSRELEAASRHKSEFLANMSHELRTPLNAVIGFSEVLTERMFGELNEKQDEYLKDIHASGQHLLSLINDILDLSKIEAGRMELELSEFDLPMAIENAMTLIRERAARRSIALHTTVDERLGRIQADERKIRQVLLNLLSNAIKFTPEGGRIEVGAKPVNGSVEVLVTDTGVGIAPEDQEAVFEEFKQVGTADKKVEGTGLGLALSRKFIELHGGKIWVKSQVGEGSTFTFTVPVRRGE